LAALALAPFALAVRYAADFGLAYNGGAEAWASGHPERVFSWMSTPFLGMAMGFVSQAANVDVGARAFMVVNLLVWLGLLVGVWSELWGRLSVRLWWLTLVAAALFAPAISNVFWLQFNPIAFALALGGFAMVRRDRRVAGLLIGASLALKPIVILLPIALLLRRDSRRAGVWTIGVAALLSIAGQAFLAWRANDVGVLSPFIALANFSSKTGKAMYACAPENYAPAALICRLGLGPSSIITAVVAVAVLAIGWHLLRAMTPSSGRTWELFAVACMLSPFIGPIGWSHYQLLLAPAMLLLVFRFAQEGAERRLWIGLIATYVLCELIWDPLESLAGAPIVLVLASYATGQFAQYVLLLTMVRWLQLRGHTMPSSHLASSDMRSGVQGGS
jgi:hypothetical protein